MSINHSTLIDYKTTAGTISASSVTRTGETSTAYGGTISAGASNVHVPLAVDVSQIVSFVMFSSQTVTMKTNSSSVPDQIFTLVAGIGQTWNSSRTDANPLTTDITDLYFSNSGTAAATVSLRFLYE